MRKVHVKVVVDLTILANDEQNIEEVLQDMDYNFAASDSVDADIVNSEIKEWEVTDSR